MATVKIPECNVHWLDISKYGFGFEGSGLDPPPPPCLIKNKSSVIFFTASRWFLNISLQSVSWLILWPSDCVQCSRLTQWRWHKSNYVWFCLTTVLASLVLFGILYILLNFLGNCSLYLINYIILVTSATMWGILPPLTQSQAIPWPSYMYVCVSRLHVFHTLTLNMILIFLHSFGYMGTWEQKAEKGWIMGK